LGQRYPEPDKRHQRIRQNIHPGNQALLEAIFEFQIQPNVEELVDTKTRHETRSKALGFKVSTADVIVTFKGKEAPPLRPLSKYFSRGSMGDGNLCLHDDWV